MTTMSGISLWFFILGFAVSYLFTAAAIPILRRFRFRQTIRDQGPRAHFSKSGTPTMGGVAFLSAFLLIFAPVAIRSQQERLSSMLLLVAALAFGAIGFTDDFLKAAKRRALGIRARHKLLLQIMVATALAMAAPAIREGVATGVRTLAQTPTWLDIPFMKARFAGLDLGLFYTGFAAFIVVGFANAANLTDGLDGLLAGTGVIAFLVFWAVCMIMGRVCLAIGCACFAGSLAGFLPHNMHPAKVFMGDTGSLAVGGALASVALFTGTEAYLILISGVLVVETVSVIVQVLSFRLFGRRVFRMSPLHHHFELLGWNEERVVKTFWAAATLFGLAGLLGLIDIL